LSQNANLNNLNNANDDQSQQSQTHSQTPNSLTITKTGSPPQPTIMYQMGGQQYVQQSGMSTPTNPQPPKKQMAAIPVRIMINKETQQTQVVIQQPHQQILLSEQSLPESTIRMIQNLGPLIAHTPTKQQQGDQNKPQQMFQSRVVQLLSPNQKQLQQATIVGHIQGNNGPIPILQRPPNTGALHAIPLASLIHQGGKQVLGKQIQLPQQPLSAAPTSYQLPQQPIPVLQSMQNVSQLKPVTTAASSGQLPALAANISSIMPNFAATAVATHQRATFKQQHTSENQTSLSTPVTYVSASYSTTIANGTTTISPANLDYSCPPEELFDSEDGEAPTTPTKVNTPTTLSSANGLSNTHARNYTTNHHSVVSPDTLPDSHDFEMRDDESDKDDNDMTDGKKRAVERQSNETNPAKIVVTSSGMSVNQSSRYGVTTSNLNLPSNPQRGELQEIPKGWLRKVVLVLGRQKVFYYNTVGKKFSNQDEIEQYFARLGQTVKTGLFSFEPLRMSVSDKPGSLNRSNHNGSFQSTQRQTLLKS